MILFRIKALICTTALLAAGVATATTGSNLLANAGFELPLEPVWEKRTPDDASRNLYREEGSGRTGAAAVLENLVPAYTRLRQGHDRSIFVEAGSRIELTAWARSELGTSGVAMVQIYCMSDEDGILSQPTSPTLSGSFGWSELSVRAVVPEGTAYIMAYLQINTAAGKVWFDNTSLVVTRLPPEPLPPAPRIALLTDLPDDHATLVQARVLFEDGLTRVDPEQTNAFEGAAGALALYAGTPPASLWPAVETYARSGGQIFMDMQAFAQCLGTTASTVTVGVVGDSYPLTERMQAGLRIVQVSDAAAGFATNQIMPRAGWPDGNLLTLPAGFTQTGLETLAEGPGGEPGLVRLALDAGSVTACDLLSLREPYYRNVDAYYAFTPVSAALGNPAVFGQYYPAKFSYDGVVAEMQRLADTYSAIRLEEEGDAAGGHSLWSLNLGTPGKPLYFLYAAAHGCEWEMGYGLMTFARLVAEGELADAVDLSKVQIKIIPLLNPSGYEAMRRQNDNGVDLNRQGDYRWESYQGRDSNGDGVYGPFDYDWKGVSPLSEPETLAYQRISSHPDLYAVLDFHGNMGVTGNRLGITAATGHPDNEIMALDLMLIANARLRGRHLMRQNGETLPSQYVLDRMDMSSGTPFLMNTSANGRFGVLIELPAQYSNSYGTLLQTDVTCEVCRAFLLAYPPPEEEIATLRKGSCIDLRRAVRRDASLRHHYTFEGPRLDTATLRLLDRAGAVELIEQAKNSISLPSLVYAEGYDPLSVAGFAVATNTTISSGRAWTSATPIGLPLAMTVECVVMPLAIPSLYGGGVLTTRAADDQRGYFLWLTPDGRFETRVGTADAQTIVATLNTGQWYYVANTYAVSGDQTTINSYSANLTEGGGLQHVIVDSVAAGHYGSSAVLGIGVLYNTPFNSDLQYFAPCAIDEVAIYEGVHGFATISNRFAALQQTTPVVAYRELFPNDAAAAARHLPREGWQAHRGPTATPATAIVIEEFNTAFDEDLLAVASLPQDTSVTQGYLNNHAGPTDTNYLYWTDELVEPLEVEQVRLITFDARCISERTVRVALRVDVAGTPENLMDDAWYVAADFTHAPGTSALVLPASPGLWHRHGFEIDGGEWTSLDFVPGSALARGESRVALPSRRCMTAFGLLQDTHLYTINTRYDNFTIHIQNESIFSLWKGMSILLR